MAASLISVVVPCYNAGDYVAEAVGSILDQTHTALEVFAIDDGSTDHTLDQLESLARGDARVRVIVNSDHFGLVSTLNRGVEEARGEYIARMDADDWSHPERFQRQVALMEQRPDVDIVGVAADLMDRKGVQVGRLPLRCLQPQAARFLSWCLSRGFPGQCMAAPSRCIHS